MIYIGTTGGMVTYDEFFESYFHSWDLMKTNNRHVARGTTKGGQVFYTNVFVPFGVNIKDHKEVINFLRRRLLSRFSYGTVVYEKENRDIIGHVKGFANIPNHGIGVVVEMTTDDVSAANTMGRITYLPEQLEVL